MQRGRRLAGRFRNSRATLAECGSAEKAGAVTDAMHTETHTLCTATQSAGRFFISGVLAMWRVGCVVGEDDHDSR